MRYLWLIAVNGVAWEYPRCGLQEDAKMTLGTGHINEIEFSPDGNLLAVAGSMGGLCDTTTLRETSLLARNSRPISSIAFSPDGRTLAVGNRRGIHVWNVNTGEKLGVLSELAMSGAWCSTRRAARLPAGKGQCQFGIPEPANNFTISTFVSGQ